MGGQALAPDRARKEGPEDAVRDLTDYQLRVLRSIPDDEARKVHTSLPAGRRLKGPKLRAAKVLVDRGYAICTGWLPDSPGQWFLRTEAGEARTHL